MAVSVDKIVPVLRELAALNARSAAQLLQYRVSVSGDVPGIERTPLRLTLRDVEGQGRSELGISVMQLLNSLLRPGIAMRALIGADGALQGVSVVQGNDALGASDVVQL